MACIPYYAVSLTPLTNHPSPPPNHRPARADLVATVGETWGEAAVKLMRDRMRADPTGRQILAERPRVTVGDIRVTLGDGSMHAQPLPAK
jgi:hypothetical protein